MIKNGSSARLFITAGIAILLLLVGRGYLAYGDFTYFFVAGADFVDGAATPAPVFVQNGQGYDGQFFYRLALNPFDFSKTGYGVTIDLVPYRVQRIMYPLIVWCLSFGGNPAMVPFVLVLVNTLAFFGILFFTLAFLKKLTGFKAPAYLPLLLCGIYMSLARDLSEVTELCFFTGTIYYLFIKNYWKITILATLTLLTRETSIVALLPLAIITAYGNFKTQNRLGGMLFLIVPFAVFTCWKIMVMNLTATAPLISVSTNLGVPFAGMIEGFMGNLDISTTKNKLQLVFWILYFIWQLMLAGLVLKTLLIRSPLQSDYFATALAGAWLCWLVFAVFLSSAIYIDDWSFVRVFSLWNMIGFLLLYYRKQPFPVLLGYYSVLLVSLTLVRLIIRP